LLKHETTKLFYDKYAYKLVIRNQLGHLFRGKQFSYTKRHLDDLQKQFEEGKTLKLVRWRREDYIDVKDFQEAQLLFNDLSRTKEDYKLRIENPRVQIYSNSKFFLDSISSKITSFKEIWEPSSEIPLEVNTVTLNRHIDCDYKITLGPRTNPEFANWYENNQDKVKIGKACLNEIKNNGYTRGMYFYVRNQRVLNLLNLLIGENIQRIDKVVYRLKSDK
jgi:hypothetical protein